MGSSRSLCDYGNKFNVCHIRAIQWKQPKPRPASFTFSANGFSITAAPVWIQSKGKSRKRQYHIALFGMENLSLGPSRSGVGAGVGVNIFMPKSGLESELLKIRRLCSPEQTHMPKFLLCLSRLQLACLYHSSESADNGPLGTQLTGQVL